MVNTNKIYFLKENYQDDDFSYPYDYEDIAYQVLEKLENLSGFDNLEVIYKNEEIYSVDDHNVTYQIEISQFDNNINDYRDYISRLPI